MQRIQICTAPGVSPGRLVFTVFIVLQVADGLITYGAVSILGTTAEANPLIQTWMHLAGPGPALVGAKLIACACGAVLYVGRTRRTLALLTALYLVGAIGPWLHLLSR